MDQPTPNPYRSPKATDGQTLPGEMRKTLLAWGARMCLFLVLQSPLTVGWGWALRNDFLGWIMMAAGFAALGIGTFTAWLLHTLSGNRIADGTATLGLGAISFFFLGLPIIQLILTWWTTGQFSLFV